MTNDTKTGDRVDLTTTNWPEIVERLRVEEAKMRAEFDRCDEPDDAAGILIPKNRPDLKEYLDLVGRLAKVEPMVERGEPDDVDILSNEAMQRAIDSADKTNRAIDQASQVPSHPEHLIGFPPAERPSAVHHITHAQVRHILEMDHPIDQMSALDELFEGEVAEQPCEHEWVVLEIETTDTTDYVDACTKCGRTKIDNCSECGRTFSFITAFCPFCHPDKVSTRKPDSEVE